MRIVVRMLALVAALSCLPVRADEPPASAPLPHPKEHTTVRGTLPGDLAGRWMTVGWIDVPGGRTRTVAALWEIKEENGQLVLTNRFADLPAAQAQAMAAANQAEERWEPKPEDVAAVAAAWDGLKEGDPRLLEIENELVARDGFDDSFTREPRSREAVWVVRQSEVYDKSAAPAMKTINVYAALAAKDGGWTGNYTTATIAAAPLPIPITLNGTFQAYRLSGAESPPRGFLGRLLDQLSGCGRR
jgi:hypothetical protein